MSTDALIDAGPFAGPHPQVLSGAAKAQRVLDEPFDWAEGTGVRALKVLVADDNGDFAISLARLLALFGHRTQIAEDGFATMEMAEVFRPQLILMDINMPGLDGYEVCQRIRGTAWGSSAVIAAVSGMGGAILRRCGPAAGFDFRLEKPLAYATLERVLARL